MHVDHVASPFLQAGYPHTEVQATLFTRVRGETVWKIGMCTEIGVPKVAKKGRRGPDLPYLAPK